MFGMFGEPPAALSAAELRKQEENAADTVQKAMIMSFLLYLSPLVIDAVKKLT